MWTLALVSTGIGGIWLAAKHWFGWLLYFVNEFIWEAYGLHTHDRALVIMAPIWGAVGLRNVVVTYRKAHRAE